MAEDAYPWDSDAIPPLAGIQPVRDGQALGRAWAAIARGDRLFLALDFDGTLTPIVSHAAQAVLPEGVRKTLAALADSGSVAVAVLSGRALADVQGRVGLSNLIYAGNHGLEIAGPGWSHVEPVALEHRDDLRRIAEALTTELARIPGAWVEDKGLTLCVHYRQADEAEWPEVHDAVRQICRGTETWLRIQAGKRTWDLLPGRECHKGTAASIIQRRLGCEQAFPIGIGDDVTDEALFATLREGLTIRVGLEQDTLAGCRVAGPADVWALLAWLARVRGLA